MKRALFVPRFRNRILVRPQYQQLTDADGKIALDLIGHYEDLQKSYDTICEQLNLPSAELGRKNTSTHDSFSKYYDAELKEIVTEYYAGDLDTFGYEFPSSEPTK